jgi:predicted nucleic acid-binding protein
MNVVVDASVVAKWLFPEVDTGKARALFGQGESGRLTLRAPALLAAEIASLLSVRVLRQLLDAREASSLYSRFAASCPDLDPISGLAAPALRLAVRFRHSAYDCFYVALAEKENCPLVTADEKLVRAFASSFPQVCLLRDWRP